MINWLNSHKSPVSLPIPDEKGKKEKSKKEELSESEEEDEEDEHDDLLSVPSKKSPMNKGRTSVSAEVYGMYNKKSAFVARVVPKTEDQKERIMKRLSQAFMFQALDEKEKEIVVNAMDEKKFK